MVHSAKQLISDTGQRPTYSRLAVLETLINARTALSQHEIQSRLSNEQHFDRVTIYRVLDWLTEHHLIHRIPSEDRAVKFQVSLPHISQQHAHLHCTQCHKIICLDEVQMRLPEEIKDYLQVESVDVTIKGRCSSCKN